MSKLYFNGFEMWSMKMGNGQGFWRTFYKEISSHGVPLYTLKRHKTLASSRRAAREQIYKIGKV